MIEISKTIGLDMGHRIPDHHSKCRHLHGHRYTVTATVTGELAAEGSQAGMVMDFGFLKGAMLEAIHDPYDHKLALYAGDPLVPFFGRRLPDYLRGLDLDHSLVVVSEIPTAENLAQLWYESLEGQIDDRIHSALIPEEVRLVRLEVQETPTSVAVYQP